MKRRKSYWRRWGVRKSNPYRQYFGSKDLERILRELWSAYRLQGDNLRFIPSPERDYTAQDSLLSTLMKTEEEILLKVPAPQYTRPKYGSVKEWWDDPLKTPMGIIECTPNMLTTFYPRNNLSISDLEEVQAVAVQESLAEACRREEEKYLRGLI